MKTLLKTTVAISITEGILMVVLLIKNKYLAVTIGPEGFGIYGILNSFFMMIAVFSGTWIATGTTKYLAEYHAKGDRDNTNLIFTFSVIVTAGTGLLLTLILISGRRWFIDQLLSEDIKESYYLLFAAAFVAMNFRPVLLAVLQGLRRVREVIISRSSLVVLDLVLVVILVWQFGLTGFFLGILLSAFWAAGVLFWASMQKEGVQFRRIPWKDPVIQLLLSFGGINFFLALVNLGSQYLQRAIVLKNMNISSVGLFHAGVALMTCLGVVSRGANFYFFPKMSEAMDNDLRNIKINEYLRFMLMVSIPLSVLAIVFGPLAILLMYSSAFVPLSSVFFWFVIGQFLIMVGSAFQSSVVGMARLKIHTVATITIHSLWVIMPLLLVRKYGIGALGMGFVAGGIAGPLINGFYLRRHINLKLSPRVIKLFGIAVLTLAGAVIIQESIWFWRVVWTIVTASFVGAMVRRKEWIKTYNYILIRLNTKKIT